MAPKKLQDQEKVRQRVLELHREGLLGYAAIGKDPGVQRSKATVQSIIKNFAGRDSVKDLPPSEKITIFHWLAVHLPYFFLQTAFELGHVSASA